ncbi:MAG: ABC transporter ATP-binding protein [Bryobacteraceae bacterium]
MSAPLRTERLTKTFRHVDALLDLTLEVPEGAVFALVGPNGAGKTTAIKTLLRIQRPTSGHAEVLGVDSRSLGAAQLARIGYVSENQQLPSWMTVGYLLSYRKAFYPAWSDEDAAELVRLYELPLDRKLSALSRGMRVKAALASSLAYRPRLIILDEPFSGLDVLVREQVIETILDRTPESTVFLASHDLAEIETFASHIAYLNQGRLQFVEEMAGLFDRFRVVEVTLDQPVELPRDLPQTWLNVERTSVVIRFTDSRFDNQLTNDEVRCRFPGARDVTARVMTLRAIVVALMKSAKTGTELMGCI